MRGVTPPDPRIVERLIGRIRSRDGSPAAWIAGGDALAVGIVTAGNQPLPPWARDLADTMVGSLLRVLSATVDDATLAERVPLALSATVLGVARPHAARVIDGAVDAWIGWTPERPDPSQGAVLLAPLVQLQLLRHDEESAADAAHALCEADGGGLSMILHDWVVARLQAHGPDRELQCFAALRAALGASWGHRPGLLVAAAATAVDRAGGRRADVLPWMRDVAAFAARDGTARLGGASG